MTTILQLLEAGADAAPAITAPDRPALTYGGLRKLAADTIGSLNGLMSTLRADIDRLRAR